MRPAGRKDSVTPCPPLTACHCSRSLSGQSKRSCSIIQAVDCRAGTHLSHTMREPMTLNCSQALAAHHQPPTGNEPKWPDRSRERYIKCGGTADMHRHIRNICHLYYYLTLRHFIQLLLLHSQCFPARCNYSWEYSQSVPAALLEWLLQVSTRMRFWQLLLILNPSQAA